MVYLQEKLAKLDAKFMVEKKKRSQRFWHTVMEILTHFTPSPARAIDTLLLILLIRLNIFASGIHGLFGSKIGCQSWLRKIFHFCFYRPTTCPHVWTSVC